MLEDFLYIKDQMQKLAKKKKPLAQEIQRMRNRRSLMPKWHSEYSLLDHDLSEKEEESDDIEEAIERYERQILYKSLLFLDYSSHMELFEQQRKVCHTAAFLLHGLMDVDDNYGGHSVTALLKRLIYEIPNGTVNTVLMGDFTSPVPGRKVSDLWSELAISINLGPRAQYETIMKRVCRDLQHENIILEFRGIDCIPEPHLEKIISDFWVPLAHAVHTANSSHFLFMFLLDYRGRVKDWKNSSMEEHARGETWQPGVPVRFPTVSHFTHQDVSKWMEQYTGYFRNILSVSLKQGSHSEIAQAILNESNDGVPDQVMWYICEQCEGSIGEGVRSW